MTHFRKGATMIVQTKSRTFRAKAAKAFSSQFDMIFPVYDLDRGGGASPARLDGRPEHHGRR